MSLRFAALGRYFRHPTLLTARVWQSVAGKTPPVRECTAQTSREQRGACAQPDVVSLWQTPSPSRELAPTRPPQLAPTKHHRAKRNVHSWDHHALESRQCCMPQGCGSASRFTRRARPWLLGAAAGSTEPAGAHSFCQRRRHSREERRHVLHQAAAASLALLFQNAIPRRCSDQEVRKTEETDRFR